MTTAELRARIFSDRSASFWLRDAIQTAEERDPAAAAIDAEALAIYLRSRLNQLTGERL